MQRTKNAEFCKQVSKGALAQAKSVIEFLLPGGHYSNKEYVVKNPTRADHNAGSFSVNYETGSWADFATQDKGKDLVSLCKYVRRFEHQTEAANYLAEYLHMGKIDVIGVIGVTSPPKRPQNGSAQESQPVDRNSNPNVMDVIDEPTWVAPVPPDAPPPDFRNASIVYPYHGKDGNILFYVLRWEKPTGDKIFSQLSFWRSTDGHYEWQLKAVPKPRPLFNLDQLYASPKKGVLITEGEKSAEAASKLFPDYVVTTWTGGTQSANDAITDWSPLYGRDVILWTDEDEVGKKAMDRVACILRNQKASISSIDNSAFIGEGAELSKGFDAADALEAGWTSESISKLQQLIKRTDYYVGMFHVSDKGVWAVGETEEKTDYLSSRIDVVAKACDQSGNSSSKVLQFTDMRRKQRTWVMPMRLLAGSGEELRATLLNMGVEITTKTADRNKFLQYLQSAKPNELALCVNKTGWNQIGEARCFVLPTSTIGSGKVRVFFQGEANDACAQEGTTQEWKDNVSRLCQGNSRLVLAVCLSLAAPVLYITGDESGGIHYRGNSSIGKTTALRVGCSIWGPAQYAKNWRATVNGMEAVCAESCDLPLFLDEIAQVKPEESGDIAYLIANGQKKSRATKTGTARASGDWRILFLSTGEISLAAQMSAGGKSSTAGQEARVVDVPADTSSHGMFETLHETEDGKTFSDLLKRSCASYYGSVGKDWLTLLCANYEETSNKLRNFKQNFLDRLDLDSSCSGQVHRVAERFALLAAAGELATEWQLTEWSQGEAFKSSAECFKAWLGNRGTHEDLEKKRILEQVKHIVELHEEDRFTRLTELLGRVGETRDTHKRLGYKRSDEHGNIYLDVLPQAFTSEFCKGVDKQQAIRHLTQANWLKPRDGKPYQSVSIPGGKTARVYRLDLHKILED